jgi:succinoglycan biosynthesis transport protein ExoP
MELRQYLTIIKRRKWIIIVTTIITTFLAVLYTLLATPQYVSETTLRVATVTNIDYTQILMNTYARIATSGTVKGELRERLELEESPSISVELVPGTELMTITVEAPDPAQAQAIANEAADILAAQSREIYSGSGQTTTEILAAQVAQAELELNEARSQYEALLAENSEDTAAIDRVTQTMDLRQRTYTTLLDQYESARVNEALLANAVSVVEPAYFPQSPSKPRAFLNIALGLLSGLAIGTVLAFVFENLDTKIYSVDQIELATQLSAAGRIPSSKDELQIARINNGHFPQLEAFRRLRTNLLTIDPNSEDFKVMLVTSAQRGEGKSTVCANLAVTIAQSGRRVIIVDCDMRLPNVHRIFNLPNKRGLTSVITNEVALEDAILDSAFPRLQVLTSGPLPPNPTELLGSQQMVDLLNALREEYDHVLLDTPAMLSVVDAAVLVPYTDRVIWVVSLAQTRRGDVDTVRRQLANVHPEIIKVVINRSSDSSEYTAYGPESEFVGKF